MTGDAEPKGTSTLRVRDYAQILLLTIVAATFLKTCVVEAYRIPSPSMENTLLVGDFVLANKFIYGAQTPQFFPFTTWRLPQLRLPAVGAIERGDVVVFELPRYAGAYYSSGASRYVKRCIGVPGDTVQIVNGRILVNGEKLGPPAQGRESHRRIFPEGYGDERIFPPGSRFNEDNYGPVRIPRRGDSLALRAETFLFVRGIVEHEGGTIRLDTDGRVLVNGVPRGMYAVQRDYYFMMGDNRDNSLDSRFWGFVPDDLVVGQVMTVYFSLEENTGDGGIFGRVRNIRWERIGMIVH